jgi:hypothetical protein
MIDSRGLFLAFGPRVEESVRGFELIERMFPETPGLLAFPRTAERFSGVFFPSLVEADLVPVTALSLWMKVLDPLVFSQPLARALFAPSGTTPVPPSEDNEMTFAQVDARTPSADEPVTVPVMFITVDSQVGSKIALRLFEPRYRYMLRVAVEGDGLFAVMGKHGTSLCMLKRYAFLSRDLQAYIEAEVLGTIVIEPGEVGPASRFGLQMATGTFSPGS